MAAFALLSANTFASYDTETDPAKEEALRNLLALRVEKTLEKASFNGNFGKQGVFTKFLKLPEEMTHLEYTAFYTPEMKETLVDFGANPENYMITRININDAMKKDLSALQEEHPYTIYLIKQEEGEITKEFPAFYFSIQDGMKHKSLIKAKSGAIVFLD